MDWATFLEGEMARREERRAHVWRLLGYALLFFGASGWYLLLERPPVHEATRAAALGASGLAFLFVASPLLDRLLGILQPESAPRSRLRLQGADLEAFLDRVGPRRRVQWPNFPEVAAAGFGVLLLARVAWENWPEDRFWAIYVAFLGASLAAVALVLLFGGAHARRVRRSMGGVLLGFFRGSVLRGGWPRPGEPLSPPRERSRFWRALDRVDRMNEAFGQYYFSFLLMVGFIGGGYWVVSWGIQHDAVVQEGIAMGAVAAVVLSGLLAGKLLAILAEDSSLRIMEQLHFALVSGDAAVTTGDRVGDAFALLDVMRTERLLADMDLDAFLENVAAYERTLAGSAPAVAAAPAPTPAPADVAEDTPT